MGNQLMKYAVRGVVSGHVQGVGFRNHVSKAVQPTSISGHALNLPDRTVEVMLVGDQQEVLQVQKSVAKGPRYAQVEAVLWKEIPREELETKEPEGFRIG